MNLKKKFLIILIAMLALCSMAAFSACDIGNAHQHTYADAWTQNSEYHWHKATCGDTDEVSGKAKHTFENGVCSVCGYTENSTPDDPDTPDTPDVPDDPDTPDTPDVPDVPDTPDTPDVPDTPDDPSQTEKKVYDMTNVKFEDDTVTYDSEEHSIFATNLPDGVTVTYEGNGKTTVGIYTVIAHFKGDETNYKPIADRQATLTIEKATYDMDSVTFEGLTVPYDGSEHSLKVEGKLPENVNVTYENNGKTAAGDYEVTAHFTGDSQNYEPIPDKKAMLKITKAVITGITFKDATYPYDGSEHSLKIEGVLPDEVTVRYENNDQTNAGSYQVKAIFDTGNNYEPLSEMTATLTIEKATYDMTKVKFEDDTVTYNGEKHSILATNLPQGVTATYDGNEAITAGEHVITAHFTGDSQNYHEIDDRQATLTIEKATYDMKGVTFESETLPYDGSEHSLKIKGVLPKEVNVTYEGNGKKNAGIYPVKAHFTGDSQNYHEIDDKQATLTIEKLELTVVFIGDSTIKYDGKPHKNYSVRATNLVGGDNVQFNITYSGDMIDMGEYTVRATIEEHENYKLTTGNTLTVTITREKHTVTFKQKNQPDKQFEVLDLAAFDTRQTPVPVEVKGYKVAWEEKDLSCVTQDITVNAVETPISYQIRYYLDNGKNSDFNPENYDITSETIILAAPTKNGYTFLGWFKDSLQGERIREITRGSTGDLNLYAKWEMTEYEITYYLSGGNNHTDNPKTYNITTEYSFGDATRDGYTFEGWYKDAGFHTQITEITQNMTGNLELYAKWKVITYDIHYHLNNGTDNKANPRTYDIETKTITLASPTREYYSFDGWFTENSFRTQIREITLGSFGELNLYAKWTPIDYTINYYLDGGNDSGRNPKTYNVETQTIYLEEATKDHYTFLGWYTSRSGGEKVEQIDLGSHGSRNLYAHWTPTVYEINYFTEGGANSPKNPKNYTVETKTIHLEDPTREYYTFDGWYKDAYYFEQIKEIVLGSFGELNLYAKWTPVEFEIRYHLNEGEKNGANNPATYNVESDFTFEKASRLHYTFLGWFTDDALSEPIERIEVGGHTELDLYAKWAYGTDGLQYSLMGNSQTVTSYTGTDADVVIPETWEGHPVSNISTRAFNDKSFLTAIVIPDSITMLGMGAFHGCSSLVSMTVPFVGGSKKTSADPDQQPFGYIFCPTSYSGSMNDYIPSALKNVTVTGGHIPNEAFQPSFLSSSYSSSYIINVILKEGVTSIGSRAFAICQNLKSVVISNSVTEIGESAFVTCSSLVTVEIGDESRLTTIGDYAFNHCGSLESIPIPDSVTSIGKSAFSDCKNLESIVIPDSVTEIGGGAFSSCSSLATVKIGSGVTKIDCFYGCTSLVNITIPKNVTAIGEYAFSNCSNLESIILPDGVTSIGDWAFERCESLKYIVIPESLTYVGMRAFYVCSSVYYKGTAEQWSRIYMEDGRGNELDRANRYYYSAQPNYDGQHWYYDEHGVPTVW